jgi:cell shape-determining protein MreC
MEDVSGAGMTDMTEEEKVQVLREQLEGLRHNESEAEQLKAQIRRLGYVPDRATW